MKLNLIKTRAITTTLLIIDFITVVFTGIGLSQAPSGRIAYETHWTFLGFPKLKLERLHTRAGFLMVILVIFHFSLNYPMYINELKFLLKSHRQSSTNTKK